MFGAQSAFAPISQSSRRVSYLDVMKRPIGSEQQRLRARDIPRLAILAVITGLVTLVVTALPRFEVVESAMNDENFTDLVLKTRGELPIDTNIRVLVYDQAILDSSDRVDRAALAMRLAAVLELEPTVVAVDFLIEDRRPESPEGDEMLKALIASHRNLIFGIFHEDSLHRFRVPPAWFEIPEAQLGCINLQEDKDRAIRTFSRVWGDPSKKVWESFDVVFARWIDPPAVRHLSRYSQKTFVIDYAAGIGEVARDAQLGGSQIFPVLPLDSVFSAVISGDSARRAVYRDFLYGKGVLIGYGDLRSGQVTSVVDRFYTPLKPEKNALPDMHGVAIHANVVNTILKRRIMEVIPTWANVIWGSSIVFVLLTWRAWIQRFSRPTTRTILFYVGFAILFLLGAFLPILAFRYTSYKFSLYTPLAGLLLAVATAETVGRGLGLITDFRRRRRLRTPIPPSLRPRLKAILASWSVDHRIQQAMHVLQIEYHRLCGILFVEASRSALIDFPDVTIASPTLPRMLRSLRAMPDEAFVVGTRAAAARDLIRRMADDDVISDTLELSRALYVALNEIRRQTAALSSLDEGANESDEAIENAAGYADLALRTLSSASEGNESNRFKALYEAIERFAMDAGVILARHSLGDDLTVDDLVPYAIRSECRTHGIEEDFIYLGTQEDANNRDDYFDLVYGGASIRCQPRYHPGLTEFRYLTEDRQRMEGTHPPIDSPGTSK